MALFLLYIQCILLYKCGTEKDCFRINDVNHGCHPQSFLILLYKCGTEKDCFKIYYVNHGCHSQSFLSNIQFVGIV